MRFAGLYTLSQQQANFCCDAFLLSFRFIINLLRGFFWSNLVQVQREMLHLLKLLHWVTLTSPYPVYIQQKKYVHVTLCNITLCNIMLCNVMSCCYVMLHYIMLHYATLQHVMFIYNYIYNNIIICYVTLCYVTLCYVMLHYVTWC